MTKGSFVTVDGVDCSGKTFVIQAYAKHLREQGRDVRVVKTIGEGPHGSRLRQFLMTIPEGVPRINPFSEALIFLAAIKDCYESHTKDFVAAGGVVLMDRYVYSTYVYQTLATMLQWQKDHDDTPVQAFGYIASLMTVMPVPDLSVIIQVSQETMLANMAERGVDNHFDNFCAQNAVAFIESYAGLEHTDTFKDPAHRFVTFNNDRDKYGSPLDFTVLDHFLTLGHVSSDLDI